MIIDNSAWHMRMCRSSYGASFVPNNLCKYFWSVLGAPLVLLAQLCGRMSLGLMRVTGRVLLIPLGPVGQWLGEGIMSISEETEQRVGKVLSGVVITIVLTSIIFLLTLAALEWHWWLLWGVGIGLGSIILFMVVVIGLVETTRWVNDHRPHMKPSVRQPKPPKPRKVGDSTLRILWTFIWAKKKKLCPLIEVAVETGGGTS